MDNEYKWILLKTKGYVTGFYYENLTSGTTVMRLGVTSDGISGTATPRAPQYHACDIPLPPIAGPNAGLFLSVAVLHDLEKVDLCRTSTRCTGILIHYVDGRSVALGQWRNLDVSQHSCIYNNSTTSTLDLYFKMARSGSHKIVTDIRFSEHTSEAVPDAEYQVFGMGTVKMSANLLAGELLTCHTAHRLVVLGVTRCGLALDRRFSGRSSGKSNKPGAIDSVIKGFLEVSSYVMMYPVSPLP